MKSLPSELTQHLAGQCTTLCNCWRIIRRDGLQLGFTDHDRDLQFDGTIFEAASGFSAGEVESALGFALDSQSVQGALTSDRITAADIRADRYDGARVEMWTVNWADTQARVLEKTFVLGETTEQDQLFRVELQGISSRLARRSGRRFAQNCDADLGDSRCRVDLGKPGLRGDCTVTRFEPPLGLVVEGANAFSNGWFRSGHAEFLDGQHAGLAVEIAEHVKHSGVVTLQLWKYPGFDPVPGNTIRLTAGCDKTFSHCRAKFSNYLNFQGFPHMPGNDFTFGYAGGLRRMDGGSLIK